MIIKYSLYIPLFFKYSYLKFEISLMFFKKP